MYLLTEFESPILAATHKSSTAPGRVTTLFHSVTILNKTTVPNSVTKQTHVSSNKTFLSNCNWKILKKHFARR